MSSSSIPPSKNIGVCFKGGQKLSNDSSDGWGRWALMLLRDLKFAKETPDNEPKCMRLSTFRPERPQFPTVCEQPMD